MTKSAMIKEKIMQLLSDGSPHSVSEMKDYLVEFGRKIGSYGKAGFIHKI